MAKRKRGTAGKTTSSLGSASPRPAPVAVGGGPQVASTARPPAAPGVPAPGAAAPTPPAAPKLVDPFLTADDMLAVNDWLTGFSSQLLEIDTNIANLGIDTAFQKGQNDRAATVNRTAADDAMAGRGIFTSSLRNAAVYDIEASRALANTYLDNKLNEAVTTGAASKALLATAKVQFDAGMSAKAAQNAKAVNDPLNAAYAAELAAFKPPPPPLVAKPPASAGGGPQVAKPPTVPSGTTGVKPGGPAKPGAQPNMQQGAGRLDGSRPKRPRPRTGTVLGRRSSGLGGL
jgi:hypothetical protein